MDYIAVHKYGKDQENSKVQWESYRYGKPVWVTEWAGNGGGGGPNWPETAVDHIQFLADTTRWLESEDNVYRYAWFVGRNKEGVGNFPHNGLLAENGATTALGEVYLLFQATATNTQLRSISLPLAPMIYKAFPILKYLMAIVLLQPLQMALAIAV